MRQNSRMVAPFFGANTEALKFEATSNCGIKSDW